MKIALLGNCQTLAYTKYLIHLAPNYDIKWVCPSCFKDVLWHTRENLWGKKLLKNRILNSSQQEVFLNSCNFIICNPISKNSCDVHNLENLKALYNNKILTISACPPPPRLDNIQKTINIERELDIDIKISEVFLNNPNKAKIISDIASHPNTFFLLEATRMICKKLDMPFFDNEEYNNLLNKGYPFEVR